MYAVVGGIMLVALIVVLVAAWWYSSHMESAAQALQHEMQQQRQKELYACLYADYDQATRELKFPEKVEWVLWKASGESYNGIGDRVYADVGDIVAVGHTCNIAVGDRLYVSVYG